MQLNANIPYVRAFVRNCYLFSDKNNEDLTECYLFGVKAIINRPLLFHAQLDNGAVFWSLPLAAFCQNSEFDRIDADEGKRLSMLQYWDMQGNDISVTVFTYLQGSNVECKRRDGKCIAGTYIFTIDDYYADNNALPSGYAVDSDSKCFHIIRGEDGNFYGYPNNYLKWHNLNFVEIPDKFPSYKAISFTGKSEHIAVEEELNATI